MRFGGTVELHLHMDICMSFEAVAALDPAVDADTYRRHFVGPERFDSLVSFLDSTERHVELLQTERGLRSCMRDLRAQLAADGALHAEARFAPLRHIEGDLTAREVVEIVVEEARAWQRDGLSCAVIACALRHYSEAESIRTAQLATTLHSEDLPVAFDLAGDEAGYPLATHLPAFEIVRGPVRRSRSTRGRRPEPTASGRSSTVCSPGGSVTASGRSRIPTSSPVWCERACTWRPARPATCSSASSPPWPSTPSTHSPQRASQSAYPPTNEPSPTPPSPRRCAAWRRPSGGSEACWRAANWMRWKRPSSPSRRVPGCGRVS
ncbi:MAG: hypothetical protein OXE75_10215 [bacterium]|nr:hypothetical protein [bacterium]